MWSWCWLIWSSGSDHEGVGFSAPWINQYNYASLNCRCLKLSERYVDTTQSRYLQLETCFDLNFHATQKHENTINGFHYTSSGRLVKHRQECTYSSLGYETVQDVDYEDELDLLVVLSSHDSEIMGCVGRIGLYDNQTGVCVKEIFVKDWDQDSCHSIMMERNVICHIFKSPLGKFSCHVYRLVLEEVILRWQWGKIGWIWLKKINYDKLCHIVGGA